jgi:MOSC domain-containing protein
METRKQMLPEWTDAKRFNHYYRFAVNTSIPVSEAGKKLRVGDWVSLRHERSPTRS